MEIQILPLITYAENEGKLSSLEFRLVDIVFGSLLLVEINIWKRAFNIKNLYQFKLKCILNCHILPKNYVRTSPLIHFK